MSEDEAARLGEVCGMSPASSSPLLEPRGRKRSAVSELGSSRQRNLSAVSNVSSVLHSGSEDSYSEDEMFRPRFKHGLSAEEANDDLEDRMQKNRERNRVHARRTRERKKMKLGELQDKAAQLQEEQRVLQEAVDERNTAHLLLCLSGGGGSAPETAAAPPTAVPEDLHPPGSEAVVEAYDDDMEDNISRGFTSDEDETRGAEMWQALELPPHLNLNMDMANLTAEEREQVRRERNRLHAKRTRARKKLVFTTLQRRVAALERRNMQLSGVLREQGIEPPVAAQLPPGIARLPARIQHTVLARDYIKTEYYSERQGPPAPSSRPHMRPSQPMGGGGAGPQGRAGRMMRCSHCKCCKLNRGSMPGMAPSMPRIQELPHDEAPLNVTPPLQPMGSYPALPPAMSDLAPPMYQSDAPIYKPRPASMKYESAPAQYQPASMRYDPSLTKNEPEEVSEFSRARKFSVGSDYSSTPAYHAPAEYPASSQHRGAPEHKTQYPADHKGPGAYATPADNSVAGYSMPTPTRPTTHRRRRSPPPLSPRPAPTTTGPPPPASDGRVGQGG